MVNKENVYMALACKCDRCQKFFFPNENGRITKTMIYKCSLKPDGRDPIKCGDYDLCESCVKALEQWMSLYETKTTE